MKNYLTKLGTTLLLLIPYSNNVSATSVPLHLRQPKKQIYYQQEHPMYHLPLKFDFQRGLINPPESQIEKILKDGIKPIKENSK